MEDLSDRARSCYFDYETDEYQRYMNEFTKFMLLDACFILEFLFRINEDKDETIESGVQEFMNHHGRVRGTLMELLGFENQIPFFVLLELFQLTNPNPNDDGFKLIQMVRKCYADVVPKSTPHNIFAREDKPIDEIKHLIEVVHSLCIAKNYDYDAGGFIAQMVRPLCTKNHKRDLGSCIILQQICSATELEKDEQVMSFKKIGNITMMGSGPSRKTAQLYLTDFHKGILKIPCFEILDSTEIFLRNMIAYEHSYGYSKLAYPYFTDYAYFMDGLTDSPEDVTLLRRKGIIAHYLYSDEAVGRLFNTLTRGTTKPPFSIFSKTYIKVNFFGEKTWDKWNAKLKRDYFNDPWKAISTVSLVLSVVSTIKGFI